MISSIDNTGIKRTEQRIYNAGQIRYSKEHSVVDGTDTLFISILGSNQTLDPQPQSTTDEVKFHESMELNQNSSKK